jgi:hypothetical protein
LQRFFKYRVNGNVKAKFTAEVVSEDFTVADSNNQIA